MSRYVIMKGTIIGKPVYIARDEEDVKDWLAKLVMEFKEKGMLIEQDNSLTLSVLQGSSFDKYSVIACPSWDDGLEQQLEEINNAFTEANLLNRDALDKEEADCYESVKQ